MQYGIQLYSVKEEITDAKSLVKALETLKAQGYTSVEFAGYQGMPASELKAELDRVGMKAYSTHVSVDALSNHLEETLQYAKTLGLQYVALAFSKTESKEQVMGTVEVLKNAVEKAKEYGLTILYHNHAHEFEMVDGILPIDMFKAVCDLELDVFWSFAAGYDTCAYMRDNCDKIKLLHIKDGCKATRVPCGLGKGENDIFAIIQQAQALGHTSVIVENESENPMDFNDSLSSINYLQQK